MQPAVVPVGLPGDEAPPLIGHPRRGQRLRNGHQDQMLATVQSRLELPYPGTSPGEIHLVEEHLAGARHRRQAELEVRLEYPHPGLIAMA